MGHPLDEAHAKIARALVHLDELDRKAGPFVKAHPYDIVPELNEDMGRLEFVARALAPEEPVPLEFGIIAGDIAHNLRSALNYLTWRLATPPIGTGPGDATQFPIFFDQPGRTYKKIPVARFRDGENSYLAGVPRPHRTRIQRLQPYHGGRRQHLAFLAGLNNRDKHSLVNTALMLGHVQPPDLAKWPGKLMINLIPTPAIHEGAVVGWLVSLDPTHHETGERLSGDVQMKFDPTFEIAFGENPMIGGLAHFRRLTELVSLILRVFRDVF